MGLLLTGRSTKRYQGVANDEISQMSVKEFEQYESERMSKNAWIVANELVKRIDGAPVLTVSQQKNPMKCFSSIKIMSLNVRMLQQRIRKIVYLALVTCRKF